ncbi:MULTISPECIES: hypothetical protein [Rhodomicrobium]|uniref:hypothetical protein n=1 Tax=Rhodomicrobium TaxID=1068 RepID=UPI000F74B63A|nr:MULTISPECIES: hypothetical protein [Rhodomicrobium]
MRAPTEPYSPRPRRATDAKPVAVRKNLGLLGDGDEMYLLADIERSFGVRLTDADLRNVRSLGDLDDAIWRRLGRIYAGNTRCMAAMAFYALRRTLKTGNPDFRITPATPLKAFDMPPKVLASALEKREGLQMRFDIGWLAWIGWLAQFGWIILLWTLISGPFDWALPSILAVILGIAAMGVDRGAYARGDRVGDLAMRLSRQNFAAFAAKGGRVDRTGAWTALRQLAADLQKLPPDEIGRDTLLIGKPRWFSRE